MKKVLLVEDDSSLGLTLSERLTKEGFEVEWAQSGRKARDLISQSRFDLVIFDVGLPDTNGFELANELRHKTETPFIFVTAQSHAEDRLKGYELGAEEFIPKPFHLKELLLRVQHVLEKHSPLFEVQVTDDVRIDFSGRRVIRRQAVEHLNQKEYGVLRLLIENSPNVLSRDEILNRIWGEDEFPTNRTVDNVILRLRQVLSAEADFIMSVRGVGYQWIQKNIEQKKEYRK